MVKKENVTINGKEFTHTWSDAGKYIVHDGDDWKSGVTAVETLIESAPVKDAVPVDFMREYIQRDGMSIHDISVISQMYEAYKETKNHE